MREEDLYITTDDIARFAFILAFGSVVGIAAAIKRLRSRFHHSRTEETLSLIV